jgi:cyanophycin synthetase
MKKGAFAAMWVNLLIDGINETRSKEIPVTIIHMERDAIIHAYKNAAPGSLITIMCDVVPDALNFIKQLKEEEERTPSLITMDQRFD